MKLLSLISIAGSCAVCAPAMAQPIPDPADHAEHADHQQLDFPPGALPVPGAPGAYSHPDVPEGYVLIHGDIQVKLDEYLAFLNNPEAVFGGSGVSFWTGQVVPFDFVTTGTGAVSAVNQQNAINAMNQIAARTGLTFRPAVAADGSRIRFQASTGNNSPVGRQGGAQTINIFNWGTPFVIIHEVYHSLGFWHQQSASNRNGYVTINFPNIEPGREHNFDIVGSASIYGDYDFDSFMHYHRTAFSINGLNTITVNPPWAAQWQNAIGQLNHFSYWDQLVCRGLYPYSTDRWWQTGAGGSGTLTSPIGGSLPSRMATLPAGTTLFIKQPGHYSAIGTYTNPITIAAPLGATLGN